MLTKFIDVRNINEAREELLDIIRRTIDKNIIYYDGWSGFGAAAVLRSIAQAVPAMKAPPPELQFGRTIYIDCLTWISKRVMQRRIAEELKLDQETMALFDKQNEEDDFYAVDQGSRDVIWKVAAIIDQTLRESRFLMIFLNGGDEEVLLSQFGIPEYHCIVMWAFRRCFLTTAHAPSKIQDKLRYTSLLIYSNSTYILTSSEISALFREETDSIVAKHRCMWDIDPTLVTVCCLYILLMQNIFQSNTIFSWTLAHAPNYWMCDGIIQGSRAREISNALHKEISFSECDHNLMMVFDNMKEDPKIPFVVVKDDNIFFAKGPPRWVSIKLEFKKLKEDTKTLLTRASSIFIQFEGNYRSSGLPNGLFEMCSNLAVLTLSCCAFSFACPPFLHCKKLRFLGLDHCTDLDKAKLEEQSCSSKWTCLHSLYVLDLHYTCWEEILSEEKVDLMDNIMELNIEGVRGWQYMNKLQKRLPYLQRLRIIKPPRQANETSMDINESFRDKTKLEILDLSGNCDMEYLPTSLSLANKLEVLVIDGCCGLENVVLTNSSLRSFSFDAYGAASQWTSASELLPPESTRPERPSADVDKKGVKTSKISLEGCTQLKNVFLRGLPNLVELDLSGSAIKVLDFKTMVVDVPNLKRLFLLGCEHLRSIRWGPDRRTLNLKLELLCIDTRPWPGRELRASIVQHKTSRLQINAITVDARLSWSLCDLLYRARDNGMYYYYFNISITSSRVSAGVAQPEETNRGKVVVATLYGDICNEVGPMWDFPQPPTSQSDRHIEIGDGSRSVESELQSNRFDSLRSLMREYAQSLHVHDSSIGGPAMPALYICDLKWCRVERCPNLNTLFPLGASQRGSASRLETIWASDLLMARSIWTKGSSYGYDFTSLQHLHLRSCPSLKYALPVCYDNLFPSLKTLYIIHCGGLVHVFVRSNKEHHPSSVGFPKLTKIHLHDLPSLQQICEGAETQAPALESTWIRGCWSLRQLPALKGREPGMRRPTVEIEKDVWDALEWGRVDSGHHPSLYEAPVPSRYYTKRPMPRGTVLR